MQQLCVAFYTIHAVYLTNTCHICILITVETCVPELGSPLGFTRQVKVEHHLVALHPAMQ
jgi:hypothetical protein